MLKTKKELVEEILFEVLGGIHNQDSRIGERFVLRKINEGIAYLAKKNAYESNNLEGITYADGSFFSTYTNIDVSSDPDMGLKYIELPSQPIGLPRSRAFNVFPPITFGGAKSTLFKAIGMHEINAYLLLPAAPNTIFYFLQGGRIYLIHKNASKVNAYKKLNLTVASSGGNSMSDTVNMPDDAVSELKTLVIPQIRAMIAVPEDMVTDGRDIKEIQP